MNWKNMNKSQRMQLKGIACILGILLLLLLLLARILLGIFQKDVPSQIEPPPVLRYLQNVWVMEVGEDGLKVFENGQEKKYPCAEGVVISRDAREQVADILLRNEQVATVHSKTEKINGRVLSADAYGVELEGKGKFFFTKQMKGYRLYDSLSMCAPSDLMIGYDFADFVMEGDKICGILMAKEGAMEYIRVLLLNSGYGGIFHDTLELTCDTEYVVQYSGAPDGEGQAGNRPEETYRPEEMYGTEGNKETLDLTEESYQAGEVWRVRKDSPCFQAGRIKIVPSALTGKVTLLNVERSQGAPSYRGTLELLGTGQGIVAINELLLEEYLYSVVPSEMPASYPKEALKAQAVSARTYAYRSMLHAGYPEYGAHVDDSTSYQVYNNILEQEAATTAVKETYGQLLYTEDGEKPADTYYYSTSCGMGSDPGIWGGEESAEKYLMPKPVNRATMEGIQKETGPVLEQARQKALELMGEDAFRAFITEKSEDDYEFSESLYRWRYYVTKINQDKILANLQARYQANQERILTLDKNGEFRSVPVTELGKIQDIRISKRGSGGIAQELLLVTDRQTIKVLTEYNIRCILNDGETKILRQSGEESAMPALLPSAFFVIDLVKEGEEVAGYTLMGGGYGHGVGMSQNGAKAMAQEGCGMENILGFFYRGCILKRIYE